MNRALLLLITALFCLSAPASAQTVTFLAGVLKPAVITLPERVTHIYLAVRGHEEISLSESDVIAYKSITQLKQVLESTGRYAIDLAEINTAYDFPANASALTLLDWKEVGRITRRDTSSLLIVLEKYTQLYPESEVPQEQRVWRIYDYTTQKLLDEFSHQNILPQYSNSISPGINAYADRIMMHWEWVERDYYKSGNARMKAASRDLDTNNWKGATAKWQAVARDSVNDPKTAAKACYNMAIYCELEGDIAGALQWIARSKRMGNVLAVYYGRIIHERTGDTLMLKQQLAVNQGQIPLEEPDNAIVSSRTSQSKLPANNYLEKKNPNEEALKRQHIERDK